jgi:hypothetical protein
MAQPTSQAATGPPQDADLGVLFVHGIGDQQQYSTLAQFGGALQRWLNRWLEGGRPPQPKRDRTAASPLVDVVSVQHHPSDRNAPAHARMIVTQDGTEQTWLLAEAWWAPEVTPPKFSNFVRWILPMFPWLAAEYAVAASRRSDPADEPPSMKPDAKLVGAGHVVRPAVAGQPGHRGRANGRLLAPGLAPATAGGRQVGELAHGEPCQRRGRQLPVRPRCARPGRDDPAYPA